MAYNLGHIDPEERTDLYADPRDEDYAPRAAPAVARRCRRSSVMGVFAGGLWFAYNEGMHHARARSTAATSR